MELNLMESTKRGRKKKMIFQKEVIMDTHLILLLKQSKQKLILL